MTESDQRSDSTTTDPPTDSLWGLLAWRAATTPDRVMLIEEHRSATYRQVMEQAERLSDQLEQAGLGPGDVVSWQLPTSIDTVAFTFALQRAGIVQGSIMPIYGWREVTTLLDRCGSRLLVVADGADEVAAHVDIPVATLAGDRLSPLPDVAPGAHVDTRGATWIFATSGTTGAPKGVLHGDRTLISSGAALVEALRATSDDIGSIAFSYAHCGGVVYVAMALLANCPVALVPSFDPPVTAALLARLGVTMTGGSTAFYQAFSRLAAETGVHPVPSLRLLAGGGAPKPARVFYEARERLGVPVIHGLGMTEAPIALYGRLDHTDEQLAHTDGSPASGLLVKVVGPDGAALPTGAEGEILIKEGNVFIGYLPDELNAEAFDADGYFRTGDLGRLDADGHAVVTGRIKDLIIRKGENISAKEVEEVVGSHPSVAAVAVVGLPDPERGERVCAVVQLVQPKWPIDVAELRRHCLEEGLSLRKVPEQVEFVDKLAEGTQLKARKSELRRQMAERPWPR